MSRPRYSRSYRPSRMIRVVALALGMTGCALGTEAEGPFAAVGGTWAYTGSQTAPALILNGTMSITQQSGGEISGSLTWTERDALDNLQLRGAQITGRVIGLEDTDFDVLLPEARRHVARISTNGDTIDGVWASVSSGRSGTFRATRESR
jgi:hypothetical protein